MTDMFTFNLLHSNNITCAVIIQKEGVKTCLAAPVQSELADTDSLMCHKELFVNWFNVTFKVLCERFLIMTQV